MEQSPRMQHLMVDDKSLLVGDEIADLLIANSAAVAAANTGDHVSIKAIGVDGEEVVAKILLNSGTSLIGESSTSTLPEPENEEPTLYLRERLTSYGLLPDGTPWLGVDE